MAQMYHPDKVASLAPEFREVAERRMKEINIAFAALKTQGQTQAILPSDTRSDKRTEQPSSIRSRAKAALETYTAKVVQMDSEGVSKSENTMDADVAKISKAAEIRRSTSANKPEIGDKATENQIKKVPLSEQRGESAGEQDELYDEALAIVTDMDRASTSVLQRRLSVGYGRAAKILDTMEREGFISPADGAKPRKVLPTAYEFRDRVEQNLSEAAKDK
ncbi:MAG: hypothetical protein HY231_20915 [Acidobacteria bacterium]|nr:hypothetical protein [Acidobacteriota bacterium]